MSITIRAPRTNTLQPAADMRRWADRNPSAQSNAAKPIEPVGQTEGQTVGARTEVALIKRPLRSDRFNLTQNAQPPAGFVAQVIGQTLIDEMVQSADAVLRYRQTAVASANKSLKSELGRQ